MTFPLRPALFPVALLLTLAGCARPPTCPGETCGAPDAAVADAGSFLWGTEGRVGVLHADRPPPALSNIVQVINETLKVETVKVRVVMQALSPDICPPLASGGCEPLNLDEVARLFKANGWSLWPMISFPDGQPVDAASLDRYAEYVDWFLARYKDDARIRFVELHNAPMFSWAGTPAQLVELQNKTYARVKQAHPGIQVGTPGFEYFMDSNEGVQAKGSAEVAAFLDKARDARFDFWAFHGYPALTGTAPSASQTPPTKTATVNRFANVAGLLALRQALDANGWHDRPILDTEHTGALPAGQPLTPERDAVDAAYMVQELVLKRALANEQGPVLAGALPLKIRPRASGGEDAWGSLAADGSLTRAVKAVALLMAELRGAQPRARVSGAFDREDQPWVERFQTGTGALYVFFKPFAFRPGQGLALDGQALPYALDLGTVPKRLRLVGADGAVQVLPAARVVTLEAANAPKFLEVED